MSADGSITLVWGDGPNKFKFGIGQFRELQERVNTRRVAIGAPLVGPMSLVNLLKANDAWPDDARDILMLGLIGADMPLNAAHRKMVKYFDGEAPLIHMTTALAVLMAGLAGAPGDELSKKKTVTTNPTSTPPSSSQDSTGPALQ
jgi:hypothetical protein